MQIPAKKYLGSVRFSRDGDHVTANINLGLMKNFFNLCIKKLLKSRYDCFLIYRLLHYFQMFSKNFIRLNVTFFSPQHTVGYLSYRSISFVSGRERILKEFWKIKTQKNWLALKALIWFKIELVYSIWNPTVWKYNFSNSLNVRMSSQM